MTLEDLENRFTYHAPGAAKASSHAFVREACGKLALVVEEALPDCREKSLAITKIEEAMFWANAGIARNP